MRVPPLSQGILKPAKQKQESESSFPSFGQLWQSVVDFFAPEAQAAGPTYRIEFTYFSYLNDGNIVPLTTLPQQRQVARTFLILKWEISPALKWLNPITHACRTSTGGPLGVWATNLCSSGAPIYHPIIPFQSPPPPHVRLSSSGRFSNNNLWNFQDLTVIQWQNASIIGRDDGTGDCTGVQNTAGENADKIVDGGTSFCFRFVQ